MTDDIHSVLADTFDQRLKAARLLIVGDSITDAVIHFKLANGWDVNEPITDEQCAELIAFVAHHIGFDLENDITSHDQFFGGGCAVLAAYQRQDRPVDHH